MCLELWVDRGRSPHQSHVGGMAPALLPTPFIPHARVAALVRYRKEVYIESVQVTCWLHASQSVLIDAFSQLQETHQLKQIKVFVRATNWVWKFSAYCLQLLLLFSFQLTLVMAKEVLLKISQQVNHCRWSFLYLLGIAESSQKAV